MGETAVASPVTALSTVTVSGGVETSRDACRTRTAPMRSVPGRSVLSRSSRVSVRIGPPTASSVTSVMSRDPTMVNPVSPGSTTVTGSADRDRARIVSVTSSPAGTRARSIRAVTSGGEGLCKATTSHSAGITSPSLRAQEGALAVRYDHAGSSAPPG